MIWQILNVLVSLAVGLLMAYKLACLHERFSPMERWGMGLLGAGCVLTIGPILLPSGSPYDNWATFLMRVGIFVFFAGRVIAYDLRPR